MKKATLALAATLLFGAARATVIRVNNTTGSTAPYSNLQTAINAAAAGDTLLVEGSATDYGYASVGKKLRITGSGYFLNETTPNPHTQADKNETFVSNISFNAGSQGSVLEGVAMGTVIFDEDLITVQRCKMYFSALLAPTRNINGDTLRNCYMYSYISSQASGQHVSNLMVYNNIFTYNYGIEVATPNLNNVTGYFINNSFLTGSNTLQCVGFVFQNNIFGYVNFLGYAGSNTFFNNTACNSGIPAGNNNLLNQNSDSFYQPSSVATSSDGRYVLQAGSPAIGAGIMNGQAVDCGAFGGPAPYVLSGMPPIPSIYSLNAPSQVPQGTSSINITISAAAH